MICSVASHAAGADLCLAGEKRFESWGLALAIYLILLFPFVECTIEKCSPGERLSVCGKARTAETATERGASKFYYFSITISYISCLPSFFGFFFFLGKHVLGFSH